MNYTRDEVLAMLRPARDGGTLGDAAKLAGDWLTMERALSRPFGEDAFRELRDPVEPAELYAVVKRAVWNACHGRAPFAWRQLAVAIGIDRSDREVGYALDHHDLTARFDVVDNRLRARHELRCPHCRGVRARIARDWQNAGD